MIVELLEAAEKGIHSDPVGFIEEWLPKIVGELEKVENLRIQNGLLEAQLLEAEAKIVELS